MNIWTVVEIIMWLFLHLLCIKCMPHGIFGNVCVCFKLILSNDQNEQNSHPYGRMNEPANDWSIKIYYLRLSRYTWHLVEKGTQDCGGGDGSGGESYRKQSHPLYTITYNNGLINMAIFSNGEKIKKCKTHFAHIHLCMYVKHFI